jgi:hypothetical protein
LLAYSLQNRGLLHWLTSSDTIFTQGWGVAGLFFTK